MLRLHPYDMMRQLVGQGHEIINHSYSHADLTAADADWDQEVDHSTGVLRGRGFDINAFVFPYDHYNDAILQRLQTLGYLGARGGLRGRNRVNPADLDIDDPLAPFRINYDSYFEDPATGKNTHSEYRDQGDVLKAYVDDAIQQGGWAVRELHGIEDGSWGVVSISRYRAHLDDVVAKIQSNELWMDTFSNVNRYRSSRAYCGAALVQDGAITFSMYTSADCEKYATLLSVIVNATGADAIKVSQNGLDIPVQSLGVNKYLMEIDPTEGPAFVTRFESAE